MEKNTKNWMCLNDFRSHPTEIIFESKSILLKKRNARFVMECKWYNPVWTLGLFLQLLLELAPSYDHIVVLTGNGNLEEPFRKAKRNGSNVYLIGSQNTINEGLQSHAEHVLYPNNDNEEYKK